MKRGTMIGLAGGLIAGASLSALALAAAPSYAFFGGSHAATATVTTASVAAPIVAQLAAPMAAQQTRWGTVPNLADMVEKVSPSVVKIEVRAPNEARQMSGPGGENPFEGTPFQDFFRSFPGQGGQFQGELPDRRGSGSGFVIQGGYIVTNNHVVDSAKRMTVILHDGRELSATLVGTDPKTDLAVIKVEGNGLPPALQWGDSRRARPGENVFAMGSPFGLGNTVTAGIISARGREIGGTYDDYIQVDAPINQGNSGGPLFDQNGQVIGVNSAIFSPTGGNVGIGFSIPSDLAQNIVHQIITTGSVERGWLGVQIQPVTPEIAASLNLPAAKGAMVNQVTDGSPAQKAGVRERDIILAFGNRDISHLQDLTRAVADTKAGTTQDLKVIRDGRQQTLKVKIAALPADPKEVKVSELSPTAGASPASATVNELGLGLAANEQGIFVTNVKVNSPAQDAGLQRGDRIVAVNQTEVKSAEAARKAIEEARKQKRSAVLLHIERNDTRLFVGVPFSES
jgi:serine protease Do